MNASKSQIIWTTVLVGIFLIVAGLVALNEPPAGGNDVQVYDVPVGEIEHVRGNPESSVVLVEYGDFQCPACGAWEPSVQQIVREFSDDIKFVYKHLPLSSIHPNAHAAAYAAEAAASQGRFWEIHDMLYARQNEWANNPNPGSIFEEYALELGLNIEEFREAAGSSQVRQKVAEDLAGANALNLTSTPTFILNNQRIQPQGLDDFRQLIRSALPQPESTEAGS